MKIEEQTHRFIITMFDRRNPLYEKEKSGLFLRWSLDTKLLFGEMLDLFLGHHSKINLMLIK